MPAWTREHLDEGPVRLFDVVLEVARYFGWTVEHILDMPVRRFWLTVDHVMRRRKKEQQDLASAAMGHARRVDIGALPPLIEQ
jgi:hypothetical protein